MTRSEQRGAKPLKLTGHWDIYLHRGSALVEERHGFNVITTNGLEKLAQYLASSTTGTPSNPFIQIAIGTGTTAESSAQTALVTESARASGVASYVSNSIYQVTATFPSGTGTGAITEYGLFNSNAASTGTMLSRDLEDVVNKGANDTLTATIKITLS
jgi:hypothetical protein